MFAVFDKNGKQVTKAHSTTRAAIMEAFDSKIGYFLPRDWVVYLFEGFEIKELQEGE